MRRTEMEHVCTDDCEFPRETVCPLSPAALAGKGKTKELVILSVLGFSSRGYFLRFTRIMRPFDLNRNASLHASRVSSPFSVSILCVYARTYVCVRERKEERTAVYRIHFTDERIFNCSCIYVLKDISRISIVKRSVALSMAVNYLLPRIEGENE